MRDGAAFQDPAEKALQRKLARIAGAHQPINTGSRANTPAKETRDPRHVVRRCAAAPALRRRRS